MAKRFEIQYTVRGSGSFPDDMLRYDRSEAAEPEDIQWMQGRDEREVLLKREMEGPLSHVRKMIREKRVPTVARWASFGWEVTEVYEPTEAPAERAATIERELRRLLKGN